jgi:putative DNA primase/helicase
MTGRDALREHQAGALRLIQNRGAVAGQNGAGHRAEAPLLPSPRAPMEVAREFVRARYSDPAGTLLLRHWRGEFWHWRRSHWAEIEHRAVRAAAYGFTEHASFIDDDAPKPWAPNRHKIADLLDALAAVTHLTNNIDQPAWIEGDHAGVIVACGNGLLDVSTRVLHDHTPMYFNQTAVPFDYDPDAPAPERWHRFLADLWGDDFDQVRALAEWFGYVISGRLDLHKILLIVGPTRGGKGAIARTLGALVGRDNVAGPTLSSLRGDFGLAPLMGKPLAVVSDARLNGHDSSIVVERLLSVSGEDWITVNRKYREQWSGKLPSRFMICSNELPRLGDASAAIAGRFVTLLLEHSWLGREDNTLEPDLQRELPGILVWALDGLARLDEQGRFTRPDSTDAAFVTLQDLASPVRAFIRDHCVTGSDHTVKVDDLWTSWRSWADDNGHGRGGNKQVFGRDLRAALPQIRVRRQGSNPGEQIRVYVGIALKNAGDSP